MKRVFNLLMSVCVATVDAVVDAACKLAGKPRTKCVVLAYHAVNVKERPLFSKQMDVVLRHSKPVHAYAETLPAGGGHFTAITFDDGLENIIPNALPELEKRNIPSTLFIVTDFLGRGRDWEHRGGEDTRQESVMSEEQLRKLPSELVTIASHSMTHPFLPSLDRTKLLQELRGSRVKLEQMLNREVKLFSFPYGAFNPLVLDTCRDAGYERVFTALPVFAIAQPKEFVTGRVGIGCEDWPLEFRLKLAGAYRWLPYAYTLKRQIFSAIRGSARKPVKQETGEKRVA